MIENMDINSKTPRLRFPSFSEGWSEKILSECLEERNEQFPENEDYPLMAFVADKGVSPKGEKYDRSALVKDAANKKYKRTEYGDFIYSSNNLESGSIGINTYGRACISPVYSIFKTKDGIDPIFIGIMLTQKSFISKMIKYRQGVVYGQWRIPEKEFLNMRISIPSLAEQQKIAACLYEMEAMIDAQRLDVDALKEKKAGLMQQLFPHNGETTPRMRFPGFEGVWVEKKFGDLIEESQETSTIENEDVLLTSSIDGMFLNSEIFSHQRGSSTIGYRKIKKGMLILSAQNLHLGNANVNIRFESGLVSPAYKVYYIIGCLPQYLAQWIKRDATKQFFFDATTQGASGCRRNVVWEQLYKQTLPLPSLEEQQKIAECLSALDDQIAAESAKLESLKDHKKGLMQQLFPQPDK